MKITILEILKETPFTLNVWASRLAMCQGIMNNFKSEIVQGVIDFKGKRDVSNYNIGGYSDVVNKVWNEYSDEQDFNSVYWQEKNLQFTSDFIMKLSGTRKEARLNLKKEKIIEMKDEIIRLEKEIKNSVA